MRASPALEQQWQQTGTVEPRRFVCERCGGTGWQEAGRYNPATGHYDAIEGECDDCHGEGYLGFMPAREEAS